MIQKFLSIILFSFLVAQDYPTLGSDTSLDVMTWNVENYPKSGQTNSYLIDIINDIDVDIIAFQEIESLNAFNNLINQLDGNWVGYRSGGPSSSYGELSYAINLDEIQINSIYTILSEDAYFFAYREPYVIEITHQSSNYIIINNHFKCCGDGYLDLDDTSDEEYRRLISSQLLEQYVNDNYSNDNVIILGDLNDIIQDSESNNVFWNFLSSNDFQFADYDIAYGPSSNWSYPTWPSHIDHILITDELFPNFESSNVLVFSVDEYLSGGWSSYEMFISDHRPVFIQFDFGENDMGDMNSDGSIDVLDVIIMVSYILDNEYSITGDINYDGTLNIMDVVILVNGILN